MSDEKNLNDKELILELMKERDRLRAEVERLTTELDHTEKVYRMNREYVEDCKELRAAAEKLAEALEFYSGLIPHAEKIGLGEPNREIGLMPAKFGTLLMEVLAEYRRKFPNPAKE